MSGQPDGLSMTVGVKELYDGIKSVETKVDAILGQDLDRRMTALENWRWWVMGIASGVGALGGIVTGLFVNKP